MTERRNGQDGVGPFTLENRQLILDRLLEIQEQVRLTLISQPEIKRIQEIWRDDEGMFAINHANRLLTILES